MATTIPDKLYVTVQYRKDATELLGFASPYTKDAAFKKRKVTQDVWAYGRGTDFVIDDQDGVSNGPDNTNQNAAEFFMTGCYPRIVRNEPVTGFEISKSVRRYGWSGSGNVVWRITDPRGYELEVTSENFAKIVDCATLVNGVIQGACVWGREGNKNVLLPVSSEPYQTAFTHTSLVKNKVSLKDVEVGDLITLLDKSQETGYRDAVYLGRMHTVFTANVGDTSAYSYSGEIKLLGGIADRYVFKDAEDEEYFSVGKAEIGAILEKGHSKNTLEDNLNEINEYLSGGQLVAGFATTTIMVLAKAADLKNVTICLEDAPLVMSNNRFQEVKAGYYTRGELLLVTKDNTDWYLTANSRSDKPGSAYGQVDGILYGIDYAELGQNTLKVLTRLEIIAPANYWNPSRSSVVPAHVVTQFDPASYRAKAIWCKAGNLKARIRNTLGAVAGITRSY